MFLVQIRPQVSEQRENVVSKGKQLTVTCCGHPTTTGGLKFTVVGHFGALGGPVPGLLDAGIVLSPFWCVTISARFH